MTLFLAESFLLRVLFGLPLQSTPVIGLFVTFTVKKNKTPKSLFAVEWLMITLTSKLEAIVTQSEGNMLLIWLFENMKLINRKSPTIISFC